MKDLAGKTVLLIAPKFFGYETEIIQEIKRRGAIVNYLADRPFNKAWQTTLTRFTPWLIQPWVERFYKHQLKHFKADHYDMILVINGQTLSLKTLLEIKALYPTAKTVLYMWDSIANRPRTIHTLKHYDRTYSFDSKDVAQFNMQLRPLFYTSGFTSQHKTQFKYDVSFIGTIHSDRYAVIKKIQDRLDANVKSFWYLYLQAKWVLGVFKILKQAMRKAKLQEFQFHPIAKNDLQNIFAESKAIIDIEHPKQNGLTMRTFEALGANKKLITTNKNIQNYDFFKEDNICIIERNNPSIPKGFLKSEYQALPAEITYKYSISGWLDELLN